MENNQILTEQLKKALKLDVQEETMSSDSPSTFSSSESSYYPSRLLNLDWNRENHSNDDTLNIFKQIFGQSSPLSTSQTQNDPIHNSKYKFLAVPPLNIETVTECVCVPTSKHVAQILGKKGNKIRTLRETTKTYIRSPLPNEEPVFIVKGKKEEVLKAVEAIKLASDFFTTLDNEKSSEVEKKSHRKRTIAVKLSIPESFVGLVVGIKGGTIKEIEKATNTYIKSPTMHGEPVFTITGIPEHCEKTMNFISRYLDYRGVGPGTFVECANDLESDYSFAWININVDQAN